MCFLYQNATSTRPPMWIPGITACPSDRSIRSCSQEADGFPWCKFGVNFLKPISLSVSMGAQMLLSLYFMLGFILFQWFLRSPHAGSTGRFHYLWKLVLNSSMTAVKISVFWTICPDFSLSQSIWAEYAVCIKFPSRPVVSLQRISLTESTSVIKEDVVRPPVRGIKYSSLCINIIGVTSDGNIETEGLLRFEEYTNEDVMSSWQSDGA